MSKAHRHSIARSTLLNAILCVLVLTAVLLGYLVYEKLARHRSPGEVWNSYSTPSTKSEPTRSVEPDSSVGSGDVYASMTDAMLVEQMPNTGEVSTKALEAYGNAVYARAIRTQEVRIGEACKAEPPIIVIAQGSTVLFTNASDQPRTLHLMPDRPEEIPPGGSASAVIDFETGKGVYGFVCDSDKIPSGILVVQ